jgi:hypothetical protein
MMQTQVIRFLDRRSWCVFPKERSDLPQAISKLHLDNSYPVIVLIGGDIDKNHAALTRNAIQILARVAEEVNALVICGGTDMGVMADIGQIRSENKYRFPLVGMAPEELVAWPAGQRNTKFLWWGTERWQLESHYSHFILVPGDQFGDESAWIVDAATLLSKGQRSVTILINGGEVSRKDIELSLKNSRPVIALSLTGCLADEFAGQLHRQKLLTIVPANSEPEIIKAVKDALSLGKPSAPAQSPIDKTPAAV